MTKINAVSVNGLTKVYAKKSTNPVLALNELNLEVKEGEIFGLLGPNGAGKTTFLNILAGTVIKNSGSVNVWGYDLDQNPRQVRSSIGIVPQEVNLDAFFSPRNLLELQAGLYGIPKKERITFQKQRLLPRAAPIELANFAQKVLESAQELLSKWLK